MNSYGTLKLIPLLSLLVFFQALYSEGFATGTLVATEAGLVPIEQLFKQDTIIFPNHNLKMNAFSISDTSDYVIDTYLKIGISGESVCVTPDQKFYLFDKHIWIAAQELRPFDLLMDCNGSSICVESIENIYQAQRMHKLSIEKSHAFCISSYGLIVHNCEPVSAATITTTIAVICPPALPFIVIGEIVAGIIAGAGIYSIHRASKKNRLLDNPIEQNLNDFHSNSGNWHDPEDENKNIFEAIKLRTDKKLRHKRFGNFYRDPKTQLWWSKDRGGHGGSVFKVFKEQAKGLEWFFDADELGNQIVAKHKGPIGFFIPYKELISCP